jgi:hypothetical protein
MCKYRANQYVKGRMGETREKNKEYDSTLSCRFGTVECLRRRFDQETMGQVKDLIPVEIPSK